MPALLIRYPEIIFLCGENKYTEIANKQGRGGQGAEWQGAGVTISLLFNQAECTTASRPHLIEFDIFTAQNYYKLTKTCTVNLQYTCHYLLSSRLPSDNKCANSGRQN